MQPTLLLRGFTLIEILITLTLFSLFATAISVWGVSNYLSAQTRSDKDTIVTSLVETRAESQNNVCLSTCLILPSHGVYFNKNVLTVFEGASFLTRNKEFDLQLPLSGKGTFSGDTEVLFAPHTGNGLSNYSLQYEVGSTTTEFEITTSGQISEFYI
jgi:prepilin-type N-terminal cleavage/methylation domain-containing protein